MGVSSCVACVAGKFELKFNLKNKTCFQKNVWGNLEIPATHATSATNWCKCMILKGNNVYQLLRFTCYTLFKPATHYINPLKATHLRTVSTSNAPRNTLSEPSIANRGLRTKDLRVFLLECFMGYLRYSFMVWWLRALNRASRASNPMRPHFETRFQS